MRKNKQSNTSPKTRTRPKNIRTHSFSASLWRYPSEWASWFFLSVSKDLSLTIKGDYAQHLKGFCSLPATITIGTTTWQTSLFFDSRSRMFLLPVKKTVRDLEGIQEGDRVVASFTYRGTR
jgi:hypothetical protein